MHAKTMFVLQFSTLCLEKRYSQQDKKNNYLVQPRLNLTAKFSTFWPYKYILWKKIIGTNVSFPPSNLSILFGKFFLKTSKVVIDVDKGSLEIEQWGKIEHFWYNIWYTSTNPSCISVCLV